MKRHDARSRPQEPHEPRGSWQRRSWHERSTLTPELEATKQWLLSHTRTLLTASNPKR